MKIVTAMIIAVLVAGAAVGGWFLGRGGGDGKGPTTGERQVAFYQSPMHPWIKSDQPGNCTICGMKLAPVYEGEQGFAAEEGVVVLSTNAVNVINVQTEPAREVELTRQVEVAGRIESDETRRRVISAYVDGRVEELFVNYAGAEVREGEPLATIYSPALLTAEREYLTVLGQTNLAGSATVGPQHARMVEAARQRLKRLGLQDAQIKELGEKPGTNYTTQITAPISGTVITREVYEGQYVEEGDKLFEIADFSRMWFRFDVYEQDLPWIELGQRVQVSSPALGGKTFEGPITFIEPTLDERTRSAKVRVELKNPLAGEEGRQRRDLLNNVYAQGMIEVRTGATLAVPRSAVLQPGDYPRVYVSTGGGAYEPVRVRLGRRGERHWEILEGLEGGEEVVTSGNLLIDSQAQVQGGGGAHVHGAEGMEQPLERKPAGQEHTSHFSPSESQAEAVGRLFEISSTINESLAADDPGAFQKHAGALGEAAKQVAKEFAGTPLEQAAKQLAERARFGTAQSLDAAREMYMPFSNAAGEFALGLKQSTHGAEPRVFKCPMYPAPGKTVYWVQEELPLRNPFYGSEMLECGTEVK